MGHASLRGRPCGLVQVATSIVRIGLESLALGQVAEFKEVPFKPETTDSVAIDQSAGGHDESDIPEAKPEGQEEADSSEDSDTTDGDTDSK